MCIGLQNAFKKAIKTFKTKNVIPIASKSRSIAHKLEGAIKGFLSFLANFFENIEMKTRKLKQI